MKVLTTIDLLALPSLETPPAGHVGFGAKSDGLYQKVGTVETKLSIDGHTHTIANITGLQGALDSKATHSDITTAVNNLQIGGRNYLRKKDFTKRGGDFEEIEPYKDIPTFRQTVTYLDKNNAGFDIKSTFIDIPKGTSFTISYYIRNLVNNESLASSYLMVMYKNGTTKTYGIAPTFSGLGIWSKQIKTFTAEEDIERILGFIYKDYATVGTIYESTIPKIEKGNKATDWTPTPEDQVSDWSVTDVNSFAFIKNKPTQLSQFTDNIGVASHIANKANPHNVTKAQVGLGNVDNVKQATKSEFDTHTGNTTIHITSTERTNWNLAYANNHTHGNKSVIDALTQGHIDVLSKLSIDANGDLKIDTNAYATGELSAYGVGSGTGGGGASYSRLDAWIDYDSTKSGWVLSALLGVDLNNRLSNVESGSATSITTTGSGNAITSVSKSGNLLTFNKGLEFSLSTHNHDAIYKPIGYVPSWSEITGKPSTFAPSAHSHSWSSITGKPSAFAPSAHTHIIADITGLQTALDGKQPTIPTGTTSQYYRGDKTWQTLNTSVVPEGTNLYFTNARVKAYGDTLYSPLGHTHTIAQITGLQGALDLKAPLASPTFTGNVTAPTFIGALSGNASSATKLQTARTIAGVSFDGTANIAIPFANLSSKPTTLSGYGITDAFKYNGSFSDFNTATLMGIYASNFQPTNAPVFTNWFNIVNLSPGNSNYITQLVTTINKDKLWFRRTTDGGSTWSPYNELLHSNNYNSYALPLSGGTLTGDLTAPTFIGALSGNATSATKLQTARTIAGVSFDGTANIAIPFANLASKPTTLSGYGITDGALKSLTLTAGNGLTGGGTLEANRTFALGTPSTLTSASTNAVTSTSHTHAITTTTVGAPNTIVATDASGGVRGNIIRIGSNWTLELSGTELVFKYDGVIKQRMLLDGSIVAVGEVTAFGTTS